MVGLRLAVSPTRGRPPKLNGLAELRESQLAAKVSVDQFISIGVNRERGATECPDPFACIHGVAITLSGLGRTDVTDKYNLDIVQQDRDRTPLLRWCCLARGR